MILVDRDIKARVEKGYLITDNFDAGNLNGVSYDLTLDSIYRSNDKGGCFEYDLPPGETVFVKTLEKLKIPGDILGRIAEKNSRMRQGLKVDGPHYQPGHETFAYLRVNNMSDKIITLSRGMKIAQIIFEELSSEPDIPYNKQERSAFQNEIAYIGLGNYKAEYEKKMRDSYEKAKTDIEEMTDKIYANVLTIMGVLVAVFGLLTINYEAFSNAVLDTKYILIMNITLSLAITLLMGIIMVFINRAKDKWFLILYLAMIAILGVAAFLIK